MTGGWRRATALLILRMAGVSLAFAHGWPKVFALVTGQAEPLIRAVAELGFPLPMLFAWAAGLSELAGGLLIAVGMWTRIAASFTAFTMTVAAFLRHRMHLQVLGFVGLVDVPRESLQRWGSPEMAFLYLLVSVTLLFTGPGRYSLQQLFEKPKMIFG